MIGILLALATFVIVRSWLKPRTVKKRVGYFYTMLDEDIKRVLRGELVELSCGCRLRGHEALNVCQAHNAMVGAVVR